MALQAGIFNSINVGNVGIWGKLSTGPEFSLALGPFGSVGSAPWHLSGQLGIEPGYHDTNFVWMFPDVALPFFAGLTPAPGSYNGVVYEYILNTGDYQMPLLTMSGNETMLVAGTARLAVTGNVTLSGNARILILPSASLQLYVGGSVATFRGGGVVNQGPASHFQYFALAPNREVHFRLNGPLVALVYAPSAACIISSAGGGPGQVQGAIYANSLALGSDLEVHLDQAP